MIGDQIVYEPALITRGESANKKQVAVDTCTVDAYSTLLTSLGGVLPIALKKKLRPMTTAKNYTRSFRETKTDSIYGCKFSQTMASTFTRHRGNHSKRMMLDTTLRIEKDSRSDATEVGRLLFAKIDNYIATIHKPK